MSTKTEKPYTQGILSRLSREEINEINLLIESIVGNYPDTVQDVWVTVLKEQTTDKERITAIAHKANHRARTKQWEDNWRTISLHKPILDGDKTLEDRIASPEPDDPTDLQRRFVSENNPSKHSHMAKQLTDFIEPVLRPVCKFCSSPKVVKNGVRSGSQYMLCRVCGRGFTLNGALPHMRYPQYVQQEFIKLRLAGFSYMKIQQRLYKLFKTKISDTTLMSWGKKTGIETPQKDNHWRKNILSLLSKLETLPADKKYSSEELRQLFGYATKTKIEDTQLFRKGLFCPDTTGMWITKGGLEFSG